LILAKFFKKIVLWPLIILIFFSGLDALGLYFLGMQISDIVKSNQIEWWAVPFNFEAMTTQLFWQSHNTVPAWLATLVLIEQKNNRFIAVIVALTMITCTFPFVGLLILAICVVVRNFITENIHKREKVSFKDIFTIENIAGGGVIGIISYLFLKTNITGAVIEVASNQSTHANHQTPQGIFLLLLLFYMAEAGIYFIAVWKYQKNNYLLYYAIFWLAVCPLIMVGHGSDFCLKASVPAIVITMLLLVDTIDKTLSSKDFKTLIAILIIFTLGTVTPINDIRRTVAQTIYLMRSNQPITEGAISPLEGSGNFAGYIENEVFFDYLAKRSKQK
jgi:hypothetical protein